MIFIITRQLLQLKCICYWSCARCSITGSSTTSRSITIGDIGKDLTIIAGGEYDFQLNSIDVGNAFGNVRLPANSNTSGRGFNSFYFYQY